MQTTIARAETHGVEPVDVTPHAERAEGERAVAKVEVHLGVAGVVVTEEEIGPAVTVQVGDGGAAVFQPRARAVGGGCQTGRVGDVGETQGAGGRERERKKEEEEEEEWNKRGMNGGVE